MVKRGNGRGILRRDRAVGPVDADKGKVCATQHHVLSHCDDGMIC